MAANMQQIDVASEQQLESTITSYIAQGFVVSNRGPDSVTLFKKKEFNVLWAVIGFFLCVIPLIVYCIVYATQSDEMVIVKLQPGLGAREPNADALTWSEDREWWWDGRAWRDALRELPPGAVLSEDRKSWWDGKTWRQAPPEEGAEGRGRPVSEQRSNPDRPQDQTPPSAPEAASGSAEDS